MKNFIRERNPILFISFIIHTVLFFIVIFYIREKCIDVFNSNISNLDQVVNISSLIHIETSFLMITLFLLEGLSALFVMVGYIYKKEEFVVLSTGILFVIFIVYFSIGNGFLGIFSFLVMLINILGLIRK